MFSKDQAFALFSIANLMKLRIRVNNQYKNVDVLKSYLAYY